MSKVRYHMDFCVFWIFWRKLSLNIFATVQLGFEHISVSCAIVSCVCPYLLGLVVS